jgi:hypothetical protein
MAGELPVGATTRAPSTRGVAGAGNEHADQGAHTGGDSDRIIRIVAHELVGLARTLHGLAAQALEGVAPILEDIAKTVAQVIDATAGVLGGAAEDLLGLVDEGAEFLGDLWFGAGG